MSTKGSRLVVAIEPITCVWLSVVIGSVVNMISGDKPLDQSWCIYITANWVRDALALMQEY